MDEESIVKLIDTKLLPILSKLDKLDEIEKSVGFLSNSYDNLTERVKNIELKNIDLTNENCRILCYLNNATNELEQHKKDLDDLEQYIRRECLEIRGVPLGEEEDTNEIIRKVGDLVDVDIADKDISVSHRLPSKNHNADSSIIVKFVRRDIRDILYKSRTSLRNKTTHDLDPRYRRGQAKKIFIVESLTRKNNLLFNQCLKKKRELKYDYIWTHYGKILLRKNGSSPVITINNERDLKKLQ